VECAIDVKNTKVKNVMVNKISTESIAKSTMKYMVRLKKVGDSMRKNFVYIMKIDRNSKKKEPKVGREILDEAKKVLEKYDVK